MAYTTDDLRNIEKAIASGTRTVQFGDRSKTYNSVAELRESHRLISDAINGTGGNRRILAVRTTTRRALS